MVVILSWLSIICSLFDFICGSLNWDYVEGYLCWFKVVEEMILFVGWWDRNDYIGVCEDLLLCMWVNGVFGLLVVVVCGVFIFVIDNCVEEMMGWYVIMVMSFSIMD